MAACSLLVFRQMSRRDVTGVPCSVDGLHRAHLERETALPPTVPRGGATHTVLTSHTHVKRRRRSGSQGRERGRMGNRDLGVPISTDAAISMGRRRRSGPAETLALAARRGTRRNAPFLRLAWSPHAMGLGHVGCARAASPRSTHTGVALPPRYRRPVRQTHRRESPSAHLSCRG